MKEELLRELSRITPEERALRDGAPLDRTLYATGHGFAIEAAKLLRQGQLITIRPHTRFVAFPRHSHDYVEIMYMCTGQTTHLIGGGAPVRLQAGELLFLNQRASHAIQRADAGDVAVNFIVLPQFFDFAFSIIGTSNLLGQFLLGTLQSGGAEISHLVCHTAGLLPVQNLVESMVWSLLNNEPGARRANQLRMALLLLDLLDHPGCIEIPPEPGQGSPLVLAALREIEDDCRGASLTRVAQAYPVLLRLTPEGCTAHLPDFPKLQITAPSMDAALLAAKQQIEKALRQYRYPPAPTRQEQIVVPENCVLVLMKAG